MNILICGAGEVGRHSAEVLAASGHSITIIDRSSSRLAEIDGLSETDRAELVDGAAQRVEMVVYPAYARLAETLDGLVPQAGRDAGVWRIGEDDGAAFYQHALDSYGAGGMSGEEIHDLGLAEVARITAEMDAILTAPEQQDEGVWKYEHLRLVGRASRSERR